MVQVLAAVLERARSRQSWEKITVETAAHWSNVLAADEGSPSVHWVDWGRTLASPPGLCHGIADRPEHRSAQRRARPLPCRRCHCSCSRGQPDGLRASHGGRDGFDLSVCFELSMPAATAPSVVRFPGKALTARSGAVPSARAAIGGEAIGTPRR